MKEITTFNSIYCSGLFIPNQASVTAISLLFDKVYLPNNIEFAINFAKHYTIKSDSTRYKDMSIKDMENENPTDPFNELNDSQKETAYKYLDWTMNFAQSNHELFGNIFESNIFVDNNPIKVDLIEKGKNGAKNKYKASISPMELTGDDLNEITNLIQKGYVPVVGNIHGKKSLEKFGTTDIGAKQLASILAMQSIEMFFPSTEPVPAQMILEARDKLSDHLPVYWSSMLKLSKELKPLVENCTTHSEIINEGKEMIDTIVRPALIDLNDKIEKERKQWFYKIFGRAYKGLKMVASNPPITQEQLIKSSLLLGADTAVGIANDFQKVESMKSEAGLTYLLELSTLAKRPNKS